MTPELARTFARYNRWMNERLYETCAAIPDGQLTTLLSQRGIDPGVTDLMWLPPA